MMAQAALEAWLLMRSVSSSWLLFRSAHDAWFEPNVSQRQLCSQRKPQAATPDCMLMRPSMKGDILAMHTLMT